jgi:Flp pilus assembly secretin CpaC
MRKTVCLPMIIIFFTSLSAQTGSRRGNAAKTVFEGQPATLRLAPHRTTTIRLPDPVNSVVIGDPNLFQAEYSPDEPMLVFAKPTSTTAAESNLVISTTHGRQFVLSLKSPGTLPADEISGVDLLVNCRPGEIFFIEETFPSVLISETLDLASTAVAGAGISSEESGSAGANASRLDELVLRQRQQPVRNLAGERIRVGIGQVVEDDSRLIVSFSVVNSGSEPIELVSPQIQLASQTKSGMLKRTRWNTVQQLQVVDTASVIEGSNLAGVLMESSSSSAQCSSSPPNACSCKSRIQPR